MKECPQCKCQMPNTHFYTDDAKKDGLSYYCKICQRRRATVWAEAHPEERRRTMRAWRDRTDQPTNNRKIWLKRAYDLTPEDTEKLLAAQGRKCAVCRRLLTKYHVDHDHETGKVRGLLCRACNVGLGFFKDSVKRLTAAVDYIQDTA